MTCDTSTAEGRRTRLFELTDEAAHGGKKLTLTRLAGLSPSDWDSDPADAGDAPKGAEWN